MIRELYNRVKIKKSLGVRTSITYEITRLLFLGYSQESEEDIYRRASKFGFLREDTQMFIPPSYVDAFVEFTAVRYGPPEKMQKEYARWMTPSGLLWIPIPEKKGMMVEVKCTDSELLNVLNADFTSLVEKAQQEDAGEASNEGNEE